MHLHCHRASRRHPGHGCLMDVNCVGTQRGVSRPYGANRAEAERKGAREAFHAAPHLRLLAEYWRQSRKKLVSCLTQDSPTTWQALCGCLLSIFRSSSRRLREALWNITRDVAETLGKMYRIMFGIFSPPTADWAEYETQLVYFFRNGWRSSLQFGGVIHSRLRNQHPSSTRRWTRCHMTSIAVTITRILQKAAH
jgi:hypothetical protein